MSYYAVAMGQAIVSNNLLVDSVATGVLSGDTIYSCSAVVMVNTYSYMGGIYHYPDGSLYGDEKFRLKIVDAMIKLISPNRSFVRWGTGGNENVVQGSKAIDELTQYLKQRVKHCESKPASGGVVVKMQASAPNPLSRVFCCFNPSTSASVKLLSGKEVNATPVDLSKQGAGSYGSYTLLGTADVVGYREQARPEPIDISHLSGDELMVVLGLK